MGIWFIDYHAGRIGDKKLWFGGLKGEKTRLQRYFADNLKPLSYNMVPRRPICMNEVHLEC